MNKFYVTTPIYYVNDRPHIGHAYTTILADVLARAHRLLGVPTWFLTGADEHGQKVQQAAQKAGVTPKEQADRTVVRFQELWKRLEITNDDFIRTTEARHASVVQEILQDLFDRGEIYRADYDGWYDVGSETFVTEKDLDLPEGKTPADLPGIVRIREANYFFKMGAYRDWLVEYIESHPEFIQPETRRNETLGFLRTKKLADLCISRPKSRLAWGIELPFDRDYVCYVWFDALVNYISAVGYRRDEAQFARWWPASVQLIGKDILTTHTVYWPTMLKAMGLPMPRTVFAHGWWLMGDTKMSKSLGNVVNPMDMVDKYGIDAFRYFLIAEMTLGQDAGFSEEAFVRRYNSDLANDLGNLLSRVVKMIGQYCDGRVPAPVGTPAHGAERELWEAVQKAVAKMESSLAAYQLDRGVGEVIAAVRATNRYLETRAPWTQAKQADKGPLHTTLYTAVEALRVAAALLHPVMPGRMTDIRRTLGLKEPEPSIAEIRAWGVTPPGTSVSLTGSLFPRIAPQAAPGPAAATVAPPPAPAVPGIATIAYDEFMKVELRTAKVVAAEKVQGADKLLCLQVEVGGETRQVIAGIAKHYAPEALLGKTVIVVANLAAAKIRGVESRGMLLAASAGDAMRLLTVDGDLPSGARAK
jgi:methionyl-tRNA synthetase